MKKNSNKGFTLVELIVVLVILAILAAILVPALLGYIDKAREKQTTTNAEAAYVAAQALATEAYGKLEDDPCTNYVKLSKIKDLTDLRNKDIKEIYVKFNGDTGSNTSQNNSANTGKLEHKNYIISEFIYYDGTYYAHWTQESGGNWVVTQTAPSTADFKKLDE